MHKVLLTIALGVANACIALYSAMAIMCTFNCPEPNFIQSFFEFTIFPFMIIFPIGEFLENMRMSENLMLMILFTVVAIVLISFWYLLSCVILKMFNYLKRKN